MIESKELGKFDKYLKLALKKVEEFETKEFYENHVRFWAIPYQDHVLLEKIMTSFKMYQADISTCPSVKPITAKMVLWTDINKCLKKGKMGKIDVNRYIKHIDICC